MITKLALYLPEIIFYSCDEFSAGEFSASFLPSIFDQLFSASCFSTSFPLSIFGQLFSVSCFSTRFRPTYFYQLFWTSFPRVIKYDDSIVFSEAHCILFYSVQGARRNAFRICATTTPVALTLPVKNPTELTSANVLTHVK